MLGATVIATASSEGARSLRHAARSGHDSTTACMEDADGDGYGDDMPPEGVDPGTDCDDDNVGT